MKRRIRGFTVAEFVIAVVFIGVVLGPFLVFVARVHDLNSAIGQQGRREAWRSFTDQALAAGFDPTRAPAFAPGLNPAVARLPVLPVEQLAAPVIGGRPNVVPLRVVLDAAVAEPRLTGSGFQIGAGAALPPRATPAPPLPPIIMPAPDVTPADGTVVIATALSPAASGAPYTLAIVAHGTVGALVHANLSMPSITAVAIGAASLSVNAADLAKGVRGTAWSEYSGRPQAGDRSVALPDGRTRWLVATADGRTQVYEPSSCVSFAYQIHLGAPVLRHGDSDLPNGGTAAFDYSQYLAVQSGAVPVRIDFPPEVQQVFGSAWSSVPVGYQWTFGLSAGPVSGDVTPFFATDAVALWDDRVALAAAPVVSGAVVANPATWTFTRVKTPLGVPVLSTNADNGFYAAGDLQFHAPAYSGGPAIGRLSFENGSFVSTGTSLVIPVAP